MLQGIMKITLDYMSEESMRKHGEEHDRLNLLGYGVVKREKISKCPDYKDLTELDLAHLTKSGHSKIKHSKIKHSKIKHS